MSVTVFIQHLLLSDPYREMRIDFGRDYSCLELIVVSKKKSNKNKNKSERACVREKQAEKEKKRKACFKMYSDILKSEKYHFLLVILHF